MVVGETAATATTATTATTNDRKRGLRKNGNKGDGAAPAVGKSTASFLIWSLSLSLVLLGLKSNESDATTTTKTRPSSLQLFLPAAEAFVVPTGRTGTRSHPQHSVDIDINVDIDIDVHRRRTTSMVAGSSSNNNNNNTPRSLASFRLFAMPQQYQDQQEQQQNEVDGNNVNVNVNVNEEDDNNDDEDEDESSSSSSSEVKKLLMDAERLRIEAERMDARLTLQKIATLEGKLSNDAWLSKQQGQTVKDLYDELRRLESKVSSSTTDDSNNRPELSLSLSLDDKIEKLRESTSLSSSSSSSSSSSGGSDEETTIGGGGSSNSSNNKPRNRNLPPMAGFDDDDLKLYVPVATEVNKMAPELPLDERIGLFRDAPELQKHFREKIQKLILGPLEEIQELETLKQQYFESSSSKEKESLLKQIKRLEAKVDENNISKSGSGAGAGTRTSGSSDFDVSGGIGYSDNILIPSDRLPPLTEDELEERYQTIRALPDILVAVYLQRNGLYELPDTYKTINLEVGSGGVSVQVASKNTSATNADSNSNSNSNSKDSQEKTIAIVDTNKDSEEESEPSGADVTVAVAATATADNSTSLDLYENLKLAIQIDYYDLQMQLLDQARVIPLTNDMRAEFIAAYRSLPPPVRERYVVNELGIDKLDVATITSDADADIERVLKEVLQPVVDEELFVTLSKAMGGRGAGAANKEQEVVPPEYNDVEFVDRSRYLEEFFPAAAAMEDARPSQEDVDLFARECLNVIGGGGGGGGGKKSFMVTSQPERVIGGYYIRGTNQLTGDPKTLQTANERLVEEVQQRLRDHPTLSDKLEFFYILDPQPPTEEEMELEIDLNALFLITAKDPKTMYNLSSPLTKTAVTVSGLLSTFLFSIGSCVLNPKINASIEKAMDSVSTATAGSPTVYLDIDWFFNLCLPLYFSFLSILFAHELGHRIVASIYKFDIGLPNVVPSLSTGLAGAITPLKSPPPSKKALFDFAIAGPLAGLSVSIGLLFVGLELTRQMGVDTSLPVLPVDLLRASSLGGGMVQYFLGKYTLLAGQGPGAFVELHPFAVSGLIGILTNALALLPLGHTDGGRVSLAMFGRRGAFVVKLFTTLILTASGLFGLDEVNILLAYVVFTLIWQRELESPIRNEVDDISFSRALVGIISAVVVGLTLIPMTS